MSITSAMLGDATEKAAKKNPDIDFSIVDFGYEKPSDNLKGLNFDTAQPSYLAGYVAAGSSKTGKVGTFGGLNIPTVTIFMNGFLQNGAAHRAEGAAPGENPLGGDSRCTRRTDGRASRLWAFAALAATTQLRFSAA